MGQIDWAVSGDYLETCSCNYVCPCVASNLRDRPTHGWCKAALLFDVQKGHYGKISLDHLAVVVVGYIPGALVDGNWTVGLIINKEASADQQDALTAILTGRAGGPMERFAPLVGTFAGVETGIIQFEKTGMKFSFSPAFWTRRPRALGVGQIRMSHFTSTTTCTGPTRASRSLRRLVATFMHSVLIGTIPAAVTTVFLRRSNGAAPRVLASE